MRCIVCDSTDKWEDVEYSRHPMVNKEEKVPAGANNQGMSICTHCGFVGYPKKYKTEEEAKAYYHKDYRKPPRYENLITGQRKLKMHAHFLKDLFDEWKEKEIKPDVFEIGAAYGMVLNWIRGVFPEGTYGGTEFTQSYRRNAWHEYGLDLGLDFDNSKKYDLIVSFKVAEHQLDADKRLREYALALKPGGKVYISVPTWFRSMTNFGAEGFSLDYYYHPDHINVWTRQLFEQVLKKAGLKIVKFDDWMYDETYLCERDDSLMEEDLIFENVDDIKEHLKRIKQASLLEESGRVEEALKVYPAFPGAWKKNYEMGRAKAHRQSQGQAVEPFEYAFEKYIKPALESCPNNLTVLSLAVDVCMRYEKYNEAVEFINLALEKRPNNGPFLSALSQCLRQASLKQQDPEQKLKLQKEARDCSRYIAQQDIALKGDAFNWIYSDNANIPTPSEVTQ